MCLTGNSRRENIYPWTQPGVLFVDGFRAGAKGLAHALTPKRRPVVATLALGHVLSTISLG